MALPSRVARYEAWLSPSVVKCRTVAETANVQRCRLWVRSGSPWVDAACPLYPRKRTQLGHRAMSVSCRFCCRNRRTDGAGRLMPFFEAIHCHPLDCAGDLRSTLLTLATLTRRTKGRAVVAGRPTWQACAGSAQSLPT